MRYIAICKVLVQNILSLSPKLYDQINTPVQLALTTTDGTHTSDVHLVYTDAQITQKCAYCAGPSLRQFYIVLAFAYVIAIAGDAYFLDFRRIDSLRK